MFTKKKITVFLLLTFLSGLLFTKIKIPLKIKTEEYVCLNLSKRITRSFPDNIEILFYDLYSLNLDKILTNEINDIFYNNFLKIYKEHNYYIK